MAANPGPKNPKPGLGPEQATNPISGRVVFGVPGPGRDEGSPPASDRDAIRLMGAPKSKEGF